MTVYQLVAWGAPPEFRRKVDVPTPATDEVLIKVAGVGLCDSDFLFLDTPPGIIPWELPFTLGHESAGWVEQLGADVDDLELGQPVAVAGIHSCGRCQYCLRGHDNYCRVCASGRGYGEDGGLAQFLVVPRRELVPLTTLDPLCRVGPLTDAGATSYHAVKRALPKLIPGSTAVGDRCRWSRLVRGAVPPPLTGTQVIVVDLVEQRLDLARRARRAPRAPPRRRNVDAVASHRWARRDRWCRFRGRRRDHADGVGERGDARDDRERGRRRWHRQVSWACAPLECDRWIPTAASNCRPPRGDRVGGSG